jgi:hypothetical protein
MDQVYVIYDSEVTSIRGIFTSLHEANLAFEGLDSDGAIIMTIPTNVTFELIDEIKASVNADYLVDEN